MKTALSQMRYCGNLGDRPYIVAGGMDGATAIKMVEKHGGRVAFGRHFIANVSLVFSQPVEPFLRPHRSPIFLCA